jgi:hypothetical protein
MATKATTTIASERRFQGPFISQSKVSRAKFFDDSQGRFRIGRDKDAIIDVRDKDHVVAKEETRVVSALRESYRKECFFQAIKEATRCLLIAI